MFSFIIVPAFFSFFLLCINYFCIGCMKKVLVFSFSSSFIKINHSVFRKGGIPKIKFRFLYGRNWMRFWKYWGSLVRQVSQDLSAKLASLLEGCSPQARWQWTEVNSHNADIYIAIQIWFLFYSIWDISILCFQNIFNILMVWCLFPDHYVWNIIQL